jgi:hypothetical protein
VCVPGCSGGVPRPADCWGAAPSLTGSKYLNTIRTFAAPLAKYAVYEAEAADSYATVNTAPSALFRRSATLDVAYSMPDQSNWAVRLWPTDWVQYNSFQLGGSSYAVGVRYSSASGASAHIEIDGITKATFNLAPSGGLDTYTVYTHPTKFSISTGGHSIRLKLDSGEARVDFWILNGF